MGHDDTGATKSLDVRSRLVELTSGVKHVPHSNNSSKQSYWVTYPAKINIKIYQNITLESVTSLRRSSISKDSCGERTAQKRFKRPGLIENLLKAPFLIDLNNRQHGNQQGKWLSPSCSFSWWNHRFLWQKPLNKHRVHHRFLSPPWNPQFSWIPYDTLQSKPASTPQKTRAPPQPLLWISPECGQSSAELMFYDSTNARGFNVKLCWDAIPPFVARNSNLAI